MLRMLRSRVRPIDLIALVIIRYLLFTFQLYVLFKGKYSGKVQCDMLERLFFFNLLVLIFHVS